MNTVCIMTKSIFHHLCQKWLHFWPLRINKLFFFIQLNTLCACCQLLVSDVYRYKEVGGEWWSAGILFDWSWQLSDLFQFDLGSQIWGGRGSTSCGHCNRLLPPRSVYNKGVLWFMFLLSYYEGILKVLWWM